jgi:CBS domain-containing protein
MGNMSLMDMAYVPPAQIAPKDTIRAAVAAAMPYGCDAVAVIDNGNIAGILTSRDILLKVVLRRRDVESTLVGDVMTTPVITLHPSTEPEEALQLMLEKNIRHILLSEDGERATGMLSLRKLLNFLVEDQKHDLQHLEAFINVDGPGG